MKMTKVWAALLCAAMLLTLCVGCGEQPADGTASVSWDGDLKEHWHVDAEGTITDKAAHTLDEGSFCSVCNSEVLDYGDGSGAITVMNEYGDTTIFRAYATDGSVDWESKTDIVYDEQGRRASEATYSDGRLQQETTYQYGPNGDELLPLKETYYNEDGTKEETTYDEVGDMDTIVYYDADGNATKTETYEYEYSEDEQMTGKKVYTDGTLTGEEVYTPDAEGWYYLSEEITYKPDGSVDSTVKYDAQGNIVE